MLCMLIMPLSSMQCKLPALLQLRTDLLSNLRLLGQTKDHCFKGSQCEGAIHETGIIEIARQSRCLAAFCWYLPGLLLLCKIENDQEGLRGMTLGIDEELLVFWFQLSKYTVRLHSAPRQSLQNV